MIKKKLSSTDFFIFCANLLPIIGVWTGKWNPYEVFMVYALETIIVGFFTLVKMGIVTIVRKTDTWYNKGNSRVVSGLFFMLFFLFHYGMFVAIQTGIFLSISGISDKFHVGFFEFFLHWPTYIKGNLLIMLLGFIISYCFSLYWNFLRPGLYRIIPMTILMFQPYGRIFIQQFTVIIGSIFLSFGAGKIFILIFASIKIFFEVFINYEQLLDNKMKELKKESGV